MEASIRIKAGFEDDTISVVNYDGCIEKIMDLYKMSSCVIATRLHTIILAWKFNVPVFPIIYDLKVQNVLKSYNYKGASIDIRNIINLKPEDVELSFKTNSSQIDNDIITEANKQFALLDKRINDGTKK